MLGNVNWNAELAFQASGRIESPEGALEALKTPEGVVQVGAHEQPPFSNPLEEFGFARGIAVQKGQRFIGRRHVVVIALLSRLFIGCTHLVKVRRNQISVVLQGLFFVESPGVIRAGVVRDVYTPVSWATCLLRT